MQNCCLKKHHISYCTQPTHSLFKFINYTHKMNNFQHLKMAINIILTSVTVAWCVSTQQVITGVWVRISPGPGTFLVLHNFCYKLLSIHHQTTDNYYSRTWDTFNVNYMCLSVAERQPTLHTVFHKNQGDDGILYQHVSATWHSAIAKQVG